MHHPTNLLFTKFCVLKLDDMIEMELAKLMFKFNNKMLPNSFNNYFLRLDKIHKYDTRQKNVMNFSIFREFRSREEGALSHLPKIMERYSAGIQALFVTKPRSLSVYFRLPCEKLLITLT